MDTQTATLNANGAFINNICTRTVRVYCTTVAACCAAEVLYSQVRHLPPAY